MSEETQSPIGEQTNLNGLTQEEAQQVQKEIESTKGELVSEKTAELIAHAKLTARQEAEKEFVTNQKVQELEKQLAEQAKAKEELERQSAEKLENLTKKVDELTGGRQSVQVQSPFNGQVQTPTDTGEGKPDVDGMTEEQYRDMEKDSYDAFMDKRCN